MFASRLLPSAPLPIRGYAICGTQRSGSNLLCELLSATHVLGRPLDYFNAVGRRAKGALEYPSDPQAQLAEIIASRTPNDVYGFKFFAENADALAGIDWFAALPNLRFIHLTRDDVLGQAISLVRAKQTGQWRSTMAAHGEPHYDARAIRAELAGIARDDARWRTYFAANAIDAIDLRYETLVSAPKRATDVVALAMGIPAPSGVVRPTLGVQRDALTEEWRARFLRETHAPSVFPSAAMVRPRLTVSIQSKNGESRLPQLIAEARAYADEVMVGVDADSTDATIDVANGYADVVYRYRLARPGQLAPARMLQFKYATGDWILHLDDDESMEPSFDGLVGELLADARYTHYYFPRKWIVNDRPYEYIAAPPWYPNWSPRLFRNRRSLVWKPPQAHSMYAIIGPGAFDARTAILHYEPLLATPEERVAKIAAYRSNGASAESERYYDIPDDAPRVRVEPRAPRVLTSSAFRSDGDIALLKGSGLPPWGSEVLSSDLAARIVAGTSTVVRVRVRNTGTLAWMPTYTRFPARPWPELRLGFRLYTGAGEQVVFDEQRLLLPRAVEPGEEIEFLDVFESPPVAPGHYEMVWDMMSEGEAWFAECGATVLRRPLEIVAADYAGAPAAKSA
jgi:LPS sulfotransferase NodH